MTVLVFGQKALAVKWGQVRSTPPRNLG